MTDLLFLAVTANHAHKSLRLGHQLNEAQPENLREEASGGVPIASPHDGVVECDRHGFLLLGRLTRTLFARHFERSGPPCQLIEHLPGGQIEMLEFTQRFAVFDHG